MTKKIKDATDLASAMKVKSHDALIKKMAARTKNKYVDGDATGKPVYAIIDFGRWVAQCECGGAELVEDKERKFYCCSCGNKENKGKPRPVVFPSQKKEIEEEILTRNDEKWQCWTKDQTLDDLKAEKNGI